MLTQTFNSYNISVTTIIDNSVPAELAENLTDGVVFSGYQIKQFKSVKNIYSKKNLPISQLLLTGLTDDDLRLLGSGLLLLEVLITQGTSEIYKNIYKIVKMSETTSGGVVQGIDRSIDIILESYFVSELKKNNTFYDLNKVNAPLFKNIDVFNDISNFLTDNSGSSILTHYSINNLTKTNHTNYYFSTKLSNYKNLMKLVHDDRIGTSPFLFGFDECFNASQTITEIGAVSTVPGFSTEIIYLDLLDSDSIPHSDSKINEFISKYSYTRGNANFLKNYYDVSYLNNYFTSILRYKNNYNNIFDLPALDSQTLKLEKNFDKLPAIMYDSSKTKTIIEEFGNLELSDVKAIRENVLAFSKRHPKIYKVPFFEAPLDVFKLGLKNVMSLDDTSITVAADVIFRFSKKKEDEVGVIANNMNHQCSGVLYLLNFN